MDSSSHTMKKEFVTEIVIDGVPLPLNNYIQETLANMLMGFTKTLKEVGEPPSTLEIRIRKLGRPVTTDPHEYP